MARGYVPLLLLLAALWGASYLFIKVAVGELEPATMMALRLLLAACLLFGVLAARSGFSRALAELRATGRHGLVLGVLNAALPFWLIAWGETHIDSGIAAIGNATVPIFVALLAIRLRPSERPSSGSFRGQRGPVGGSICSIFRNPGGSSFITPMRFIIP